MGSLIVTHIEDNVWGEQCQCSN